MPEDDDTSFPISLRRWDKHFYYFINGALDDRVVRTLKREMSYFVQGYEKTDAFKRGTWSGQETLFYTTKAGVNYFPAGLLKQVTSVLDAFKVKYVIEGISIKDHLKKYPSLDLKWHGPKLYEYQIKAISDSVARGNAATGFGASCKRSKETTQPEQHDMKQVDALAAERRPGEEITSSCAAERRLDESACCCASIMAYKQLIYFRPSALLPLGGSSLQDGHFEGRIGGRLFLQPHTTAEYLSDLHGCVQFSQRVNVCQDPLHVHICQTISRHAWAVCVSTCHEICDTCTKVFKGCQRVTPRDRDTVSNSLKRARARVRCRRDFTTEVYGHISRYAHIPIYNRGVELPA